jgi:hypothetical protein
MTEFATALSAVGATLAALFAGLTLYLAGRREHQRWLRDVLIDAYVAYLGSSFQNMARSARNARLAGKEISELSVLRQRCDELINARWRR